jgi:hypothetical protein
LFEITETSLSAASPRSPNDIKQEILTERALTASPGAPNFARPQLFREALQRQMQTANNRVAAALVIPDYAVRMALLDFEDFPTGDEERTALLRLRLRKTVPFHVDEAQLAYSIQLEQEKHIEVLAVAIARPILHEYESVFSEAGLRVGLVTPSSLATLRLCTHGDKGLTLVAKAAGSTLSVILAQQNRIRLVRCLDLAGEGEPLRKEEQNVFPVLQQTLAYAEDQLGEPVARLLLAGFGTDTEAIGRLAEREFHIPYATIRSRFGPATQANAGLLGLLEQYAA